MDHSACSLILWLCCLEMARTTPFKPRSVRSSSVKKTVSYHFKKDRKTGLPAGPDRFSSGTHTACSVWEDSHGRVAKSQRRMGKQAMRRAYGLPRATVVTCKQLLVSTNLTSALLWSLISLNSPHQIKNAARQKHLSRMSSRQRGKVSIWQVSMQGMIWIILTHSKSGWVANYL